MTLRSAEILVTKLGAARRLLRAAIRLYFHQEDELAVHTVASAGYGILKDLKRRRGQNEAEFATQTLLLGLAGLAKERASGRLPPTVRSDKYVMDFLDKLVEKFGITAETNISSLDLAVSMDLRATAQFWDSHNRASNFLKHADRDAAGALPLKDVNNFSLLMNAMFSYESIAPDDLGFESVVLQMHFLAQRETDLASDHPFAPSVAKLRTMEEDERLAFGAFQLDRPRPEGID